MILSPECCTSFDCVASVCGAKAPLSTFDKSTVSNSTLILIVLDSFIHWAKICSKINTPPYGCLLSGSHLLDRYCLIYIIFLKVLWCLCRWRWKRVSSFVLKREDSFQSQTEYRTCCWMRTKYKIMCSGWLMTVFTVTYVIVRIMWVLFKSVTMFACLLLLWSRSRKHGRRNRGVQGVHVPPTFSGRGVQEGTLCESLCVSRCAVNGFVPF